MYLILYLLLVLNLLDHSCCKSCEEILKFENYLGLETLEAIYNYVNLLGCFICSVPKCNFDLSGCEKWSQTRMLPVYNNILEFGLAGNYFPALSKIFIYHNEKCYIEVEMMAFYHANLIRFDFRECLIGKNECSKLINHMIIDKIIFEYKYCFYFGLIFIDEDRFHFAYSRSCQVYASRYFRESSYIRYDRNICHFDINVHKPRYKFEFLQSLRRYDGVPVILPCSPGGFIVDPRTGRYVVGEKCSSSFQGQAENTGIYFIIDKVYGGNESLFFPFQRGTIGFSNLKPLYFKADGTTYTRKEMEPKLVINEGIIDRIRSGCFYFQFTIVNNKTKIIPDSVTTTEESDIKVSRNETAVIIDGKTYLICDSLLTSENLRENSSIAQFVPHTGCIVCAEPECDYTDFRCQKQASIDKIPFYNNLLEFGLFSMYLPLITTISIPLNENCYVKVEITTSGAGEKNSASIRMSECFYVHHRCSRRSSVEDVSFDLDNYHCIQIALFMHNDSRIFYGVTFECKLYASSEFDENKFFELRHPACRYKEVLDNLTATMIFFQGNDRIINGVPVMFPCSPGGFAVEPRTGRFIYNETCLKLYWFSKAGTGIDFIINKIYNGEEDLRFPFVTDMNDTFPSPIYLTNNSSPLSKDEMRPDLIPNVISENKIRNICIFMPGNFPRTTSRKRTTRGPVTLPTQTGTGNSTAPINDSLYIDFSRSAISSLPIHHSLILMLLCLYKLAKFLK